MEKSLRSSQIVIVYSRNIEIRKRLFDYEEKLKETFKTPFRTVAVPDEFDPNIPRFESQSKHNHSQLQVSQNRINLATNFDDKINEKEIKHYLVDKRNTIFDLAKYENIQFVAYIIDVNFFLEEKQINDFLKTNTGTYAITDECRDFVLKYSRVFQNNYYLNITCSKFSETKIILNENSNELRPTNDVRHGISVTVDLNTKYFFEKQNKFDESLYSSLEKLIFEIIENKKLEEYLKGEI